MMKVISLAQILSAIFLIVSILLQQKGTGIGAAFGGESTMYRTKRGAERIIFLATIVFSVLFFASIIAGFILNSSSFF